MDENEIEVISIEQRIDEGLVNVLNELEKTELGSVKRERLVKEAESYLKIYLQKQKLINEQEIAYAKMEFENEQKKLEHFLAEAKFELEEKNKEHERDLATLRFELEKSSKMLEDRIAREKLEDEKKGRRHEKILGIVRIVLDGVIKGAAVLGSEMLSLKLYSFSQAGNFMTKDEATSVGLLQNVINRMM